MNPVDRHHALELELYRLRLLRDLKNPEYRPRDEDAVLDQMEAIWHRLSPEDRRLLEAGRSPRPTAFLHDLPAVDVPIDAWLRCGAMPRVSSL